MKEELLKGLTEEQIAKVKVCKSNEELLALAKQEGFELTDEQLEAIAGGSLCYSTPTFTCPKCGSTNVSACALHGPATMYWECTCKDCKHEWRKY